MRKIDEGDPDGKQDVIHMYIFPLLKYAVILNLYQFVFALFLGVCVNHGWFVPYATYVTQKMFWSAYTLLSPLVLTMLVFRGLRIWYSTL